LLDCYFCYREPVPLCFREYVRFCSREFVPFHWFVYVCTYDLLVSSYVFLSIKFLTFDQKKIESDLIIGSKVMTFLCLHSGLE